MAKLDPISENLIRIPESLDTNASAKPLARAAKIKHTRDTTAGDDDISSWVDAIVLRTMKDREELPDPEQFDLDDVIIVNDNFYKLAVSADGDGTVASVYEGTIADLYYAGPFGGETWRGVANIHGPSEIATGGEFTSNPDNSIAMIVATGSEYMQVAVKKRVYEHFSGSTIRFEVPTWMTMDLMLESGERDQTTLEFTAVYTVDDVDYAIFQFGSAELVGDWKLHTEPVGNTFSAMFWAGPDTSGTQFTHRASAKHWLLYSPVTANVRDTRLRDLPRLPDVDNYTVNDITVVEDEWYKLQTADAETAIEFDGTVGSGIINSGGTHWRGISGVGSPSVYTPTGSWRANPDNVLALLLASSSSDIRIGVRRTSYEEAKGSALADDDRLALEVTLQSGTVDRAVLANVGTYTSQSQEFVLFQATWPAQAQDYGLWYEAAGNTLHAEVFTVDADGDATTTAFLTHIAESKYWQQFNNDDEGSRTAATQAQQTADAAIARLDALDSLVGGVDPASVNTYDDSNVVLNIVHNSVAVADTKTISDVQDTDLVVIDWVDFETYPDWSGNLVPGSTPGRGRLHVQPTAIGSRHLGYSTDIIRLQSDGSEASSSSITYINISRGSNSITFNFFHSNEGTTATGTYLPPPDFSLKVSIYRNADALDSIGGRIATLESPEARRPRKGTKIADLPFHFTNGFHSQDWQSLNTAHVVAGSDATTSISQGLNVDIRHYAQESLGFIAEMQFMEHLLENIVASSVFVPWSAIPIDGTEVSLAVAYHQIEPSGEATTEVITMKAVMSFSNGNNRPLTFTLSGGPSGLTGVALDRSGLLHIYEAV